MHVSLICYDCYDTARALVSDSSHLARVLDVGSGYFFNIYKKVDDHYEFLPDNPVFTPELLAFYGKHYSNEKPRLLTYSKISAQEGNLVYFLAARAKQKREDAQAQKSVK